VNIYGPATSIRFRHMSNLFHPSTIDGSFKHDGAGVCSGIKDENSDWNLNGHRDRIIEVTDKALGLLHTSMMSPEHQR